MAPTDLPSELEKLINLLKLEVDDERRFHSRPAETAHQRAYGGQIVAQALMAAGRCVPPERTVHSLHAYFLRSGNPAETMRFAVDVMRESSAFTTVRVVAEQAERVLLSLEASFQVEEHGPETSIPAPAVPGPEETIPIDDWQLAYPLPDQELSVPFFVDALEYRQSPESLPDGTPGRQHSPIRDVWVRTRGSLPDWPLMHSCVIAYACDKPLLGTTVLAPPLFADPRGHLITSLDHSMWFHQPCRPDEWFLMHLATLATGRARAFVRADLYRSDGTLAVSATQQGLVRPLLPT